MSEANGEALPNGWVVVAIEQLLLPLDDGRILHHGWSPQCEKGPSPSEDVWGVLKTTAVQPGVYFSEHNKRLPSRLSPRPQLEVVPGDILITCAGPRNRCGIACLVRTTRKRLILSGKMYRLRFSEKHMESRYVEAYLQTRAAQNDIDRMKTGISDSGLNLTHSRFRKLSVPLAPLKEQARIVDQLDELLSDLDAGVAALVLARVKLRHYRTAVLKAAVEGSLTAEWRKQHPNPEPALTLLTRILVERRKRWEQEQLRKFADAGKQPPANWRARYKEPVAPNTHQLPGPGNGWCWATMSQLAWSAGYGTSQKCSGTSEGLAVLRIPNIVGGRVDLANLKYAPADYLADEGEFVAVGDLLVVRTNGSRTLIGRGAVVQTNKAHMMSFASYLIRLRLVPLSPMLKWIAVVWGSSAVRQWIESRAATSAGQFNISLGVLETLAVPLPPLAEQHAIVEAVEDQLSVIDHLEGELDAKLKSAQGLRQSILRDAFSGKLVPQDPNDEPASELLKRIAAEGAARQAKPSRKRERRSDNPSKMSGKPSRKR